MTALDLDEAERLSSAATAGPWSFAHEHGARSWDVTSEHDLVPPAECGIATNARFIAHARTFVPLAVARIRELEAARARIGEVLSAEGCSCDCGHFDGLIDEHNESCDRCLRCRVEMAMRGGR